MNEKFYKVTVFAKGRHVEYTFTYKHYHNLKTNHLVIFYQDENGLRKKDYWKKYQLYEVVEQQDVVSMNRSEKKVLEIKGEIDG
jgi:hypothetical protein